MSTYETSAQQMLIESYSPFLVFIFFNGALDLYEATDRKPAQTDIFIVYKFKSSSSDL